MYNVGESVHRCGVHGHNLMCFKCGTLPLHHNLAGQPKGAVLSHDAFHSQSMAKLAVVGYSSQDTYLHLAPLFHIGGLQHSLQMTFSPHVTFVYKFLTRYIIALLTYHHFSVAI